MYLAGPMEGLSEEQMKGWRLYVRKAIAARNRYYGEAQGFVEKITVLDPTDRESYREQFLKDPTNVGHRIFRQDLQDIDSSRVVVINLLQMRELDLRCWGSICEMIYAFVKHVPVIMILPDQAAADHPFVIGCATEVHFSLEAGTKAAMSYYR